MDPAQPEFVERVRDPPNEEAMTLPLDGISIIDLTRARAGPTAVRQLADMGASVIKVESRDDPDQTFSRHGFDFQNLHRNKRSLTLDLKKPEAVAILKKMIPTTDVVIENYRPDVKRRLGIDYETLSAINPKLIYGSISGFGQSGPYRDRPGYDQIAQGLGGLMSITGLPGQGPVRVGVPIADLTAGIFLAQGILVALYERTKSGKGQWVHTSLLEAMVTMLDFQASRWLIGKEIPPQAGNDHPTGIPTGVFKTKDGHMNIAASGQQMFRRLCEALAIPSLIEDPRFKTPPDRSKNRHELTKELEKATSLGTTHDMVEALNKAGVPSGPILNVKEVFENEQVKHLGLAVPVKSPKLGDLLVQRVPSTLSRTPGSVRMPTPESGEHSDEILKALGYGAEDIARLRKEEII
jgi:crotonobetainyl-CoA:carnitine CoA-transferase CaiB-like acyl-CoA transferase